MTSQRMVYRMLWALCAASYLWLSWQWLKPPTGISPTVCPVKLVSGVPCPACGTTRSMLAVLSGHLAEALWINPLGFLAAAMVALLPFWLVWDALTGEKSLFLAYRRAETQIQQPVVAVTLAVLIICNWIWNIHKDL